MGVVWVFFSNSQLENLGHLFFCCFVVVVFLQVIFLNLYFLDIFGYTIVTASTILIPLEVESPFYRNDVITMTPLFRYS